MKHLWRLRPLLQKYRLQVLFSLVLLLLITATQFALPEIIRQVIDFGLTQGLMRLIINSALLILAIGIGNAVLSYLQIYLSEWIAAHIGYDLRNKLYDHIQHLPFSFHDHSQTGQLISRCIEDVRAIERFTGYGIFDLLRLTVLMVGIVGLLFIQNPRLAFEGAPMGEAFPITVTVGDQTFDFSFLWLFDGTIEVTVSQEGTTSDSASPYTRFVGTAPAGTTLIATSAYGSADHVVGDSREFSYKVWFTNPPAGVTFPITFKVDGETFGTYYFTWYEPGPIQLNINQYNTENGATLGEMMSSERDAVLFLNIARIEAAIKAGKTFTIGSSKVPVVDGTKAANSDLATALTFYVPVPKNPHGVNVSPDGKYFVCSANAPALGRPFLGTPVSIVLGASTGSPFSALVLLIVLIPVAFGSAGLGSVPALIAPSSVGSEVFLSTLPLTGSASNALVVVVISPAACRGGILTVLA